MLSREKRATPRCYLLYPYSTCNFGTIPWSRSVQVTIVKLRYHLNWFSNYIWCFIVVRKGRWHWILLKILFILSFVYFSRRMTIAPTCDCAFWLTKFCRNWTVRGVLWLRNIAYRPTFIPNCVACVMVICCVLNDERSNTHTHAFRAERKDEEYGKGNEGETWKSWRHGWVTGVIGCHRHAASRAGT